MKKRLISMAMTAVMALTLVVAAAPVVADAAENEASSNTTVSYEHSKETAPAAADYSVKIPASITFTSVGQIITTDLQLVWAAGTDGKTAGDVYDGADSVTIAINSANTYELKNGTAAAPYTLTYNGQSNDSIADFTMSASNTTVEGTAKLNDTTLTTAGTYTDVLTFSMTHVEGN